MIPFPWAKQRRRGFLLQETTMAILVVTVAIGGAASLLELVAKQRRTEEFQVLAALEATNVMEDLLSRSWDELANQAALVELSQACRERLPSPQLKIAIASEPGNASARRIRVEIDWQSADGRRGPPARLVAWRYQPVETKR